ncbi:MAG TPA: trimethylamine methyltransferase [Candidatus Thioglobus sp.]|nr:trimethylamine methyltransferase [Candidatus Thioglobus sp.]
MARERRRRRSGVEVKEAVKVPAYIKRKTLVHDPLSDADLRILENNAETILEEIGMVFGEDLECADIMVAAGGIRDAKDPHRVRFPRGMCREIIQASAPKQFTQHARNPERSVEIGGDNIVLSPAYGPPFIRNLDEGRRYANIDDFRNFVKLTYMSDHLHHSGGTICEPVDLPVNKRHLDMVYSHIKYSDKPFMGSVTLGERAQDSVNMAKIVFGEEFMKENCVLLSLCNTVSPLSTDPAITGSLKVYARANQGMIITTFIVGGAMAPVSVAGVAAQSLAEVLAMMALTQLIKPGCPVVYGTFVTSMSMKSGAPTFGTAEAAQAMCISGALARRLGVPFRSGGGFTSSKVSDAQAGYEAANTLHATLEAGVNISLHVAGWLEGGLTMGYEKFVMDADQAGVLATAARGIDMSENGQAMDAIREVGPQSHFLACKHTEKNYREAFYMAELSDSQSFEQWKENGSKDMETAANIKYKKMLADYELPPLDPEIDKRLLDYMKKIKGSYPDSNIA